MGVLSDPFLIRGFSLSSVTGLAPAYARGQCKYIDRPTESCLFSGNPEKSYSPHFYLTVQKIHKNLMTIMPSIIGQNPVIRMTEYIFTLDGKSKEIRRTLTYDE